MDVPPSIEQEKLGRGDVNRASVRVLHFKMNPEAQVWSEEWFQGEWFRGGDEIERACSDRISCDSNYEKVNVII